MEPSMNGDGFHREGREVMSLYAETGNGVWVNAATWHDGQGLMVEIGSPGRHTSLSLSLEELEALFYVTGTLFESGEEDDSGEQNWEDN